LRFPGSASPDACIDPFRPNLKAFLGALAKAGAQVSIADTFRPPQRAYLMYWSWQIAKNFLNPQEAKPMAGVDVDWVHRDASGAPDIPKSRAAASQMVAAYGIVAKPALSSRHTEGRAVDMNISWQGSLSIDGPNGGSTTISSPDISKV
jgi:D-alanyl-D-alanine dipeptidase